MMGSLPPPSPPALPDASECHAVIATIRTTSARGSPGSVASRRGGPQRRPEQEGQGHMKLPREAVAFDIRRAATSGETSEAGIAQCVGKAVRRYLIDRGEHEPTDLYEFVLDEVERPLFEAVFEHTQGNQSRCADLLGMARGTVRKKLRKYGII